MNYLTVLTALGSILMRILRIITSRVTIALFATALLFGAIWMSLNAVQQVTGVKTLPPILTPSEPTKKDREISENVRWLATAINRDSRELTKLLEPKEVRVRIAEAVIRHAARYNSGSIRKTVENGETLVPPRHERDYVYVTKPMAMATYNGLDGAWKDDTDIAEEVLSRRSAIEQSRTDCATHYIRAEKQGLGISRLLGKQSLVDFWAQSRELKAAMVREMRPAGKAKDKEGKEVGVAVFYCAVPSKS